MDGIFGDQKELERIFKEHQTRDSLRVYNNLVESCFDKCVTTGWSGFQSKNLETAESTCVSNCAMKFLKASQRVGMRFNEQQAIKQNGGNQ